VESANTKRNTKSEGN